MHWEPFKGRETHSSKSTPEFIYIFVSVVPRNNRAPCSPQGKHLWHKLATSESRLLVTNRNMVFGEYNINTPPTDVQKDMM